MASTGQQICDTYELLEIILHKLSTRDLLLSQRVSKQWKSVIESSKKLQQALFMRPVEAYSGRLVIKDCEHKVSCGGSINDHVQNTFTFYKNPLIEPFLKSAYGPHDPNPDHSFMQTLPQAWQHPNASWRKMILIHPPWRNSSATCYYKDVGPENRRFFDSYDQMKVNYGEIRMGELSEWLQKALRPRPGSRVSQVDLKMGFDLTPATMALLELNELKVLDDNEQLEDWKRELEAIRGEEEWVGRI